MAHTRNVVAHPFHTSIPGILAIIVVYLDVHMYVRVHEPGGGRWGWGRERSEPGRMYM